MQATGILSQALCVQKCIDHDDLEGLVSWVSSIPSGLTLFLLPLLGGSLIPERFEETSLMMAKQGINLLGVI